VWLVLAFALIYAPFVGSFDATTPHLWINWIEAVYYSGYVASTLGLGDVIATSPWLRLLTVLEAMSGLALFAAATMYVLAISRELAGASALALELSGLRLGGKEEPSLFQRADDETIGDWARDWARSLLRESYAHGQYPLLQFFRPTDPDPALLVQLGQLLSLVGEELDPAHSTEFRGFPAAA
ncbi:MAG: hypothetical protein GTN93_26425, partial [Anaerolineae bacterium]|nr:hypothetical protein [Anaerolineae bacterium]